MANGNGNGSLGGEMWKEVPAWFKLTMQLGAPTVAAGWLIYILSTGVAGDLREVKAALLQHALTSDTLTRQLGERDLKLDILIRIAQTQCVNAATDVLQRRDCVNAGR